MDNLTSAHSFPRPLCIAVSHLPFSHLKELPQQCKLPWLVTPPESQILADDMMNLTIALLIKFWIKDVHTGQSYLTPPAFYLWFVSFLNPYQYIVIICTPYSTLKTSLLIKIRRKKWVVHVACMGKWRGTNLRERCFKFLPLGDIGIYVKIILKWNFNK